MITDEEFLKIFSECTAYKDEDYDADGYVYIENIPPLFPRIRRNDPRIEGWPISEETRNKLKP